MTSARARSRLAAGLCRRRRAEHAEGVEAVVVGARQDELARGRVAERRAPPPVLGREQLGEPRAPVAREHDALDVLARGGVERGAALDEIRPQTDIGQAGLAHRRERPLTPLEEGAPARLLTVALDLGRLDPPLELRMAGQEDGRHHLRFLHDDAAAGPRYPDELLQRRARLLDVMQHVATPDPVESPRGGVDGRGVALPEIEPARGARAHELSRRLDALDRALDSEDAPARSDRLRKPERVEADAAADVEPAGARPELEVGDGRARLRFLKSVQPLERLLVRLLGLRALVMR